MKVTIVGGDATADGLAAIAGDAEIEARVIAETPGAERSAAALAERLRELERAILAESPEAVLVVDDTDSALAAVLVATKLGVAVVTAAEAIPTSSNGRLIERLADERLPDGPSGLADWVRTYTEPG